MIWIAIYPVDSRAIKILNNRGYATPDASRIVQFSWRHEQLSCPEYPLTPVHIAPTGSTMQRNLHVDMWRRISFKMLRGAASLLYRKHNKIIVLVCS